MTALMCAGHLSTSAQQVEAHFTRLVPAASRLAVKPLRNASAADDITEEMGTALQMAAIPFLGRLLLFAAGDTKAGKDLRQQALAAEPRLLEVTADILRRGTGGPGGPVPDADDFGSASWVLTAFLEVRSRSQVSPKWACKP